MVSSRYPTLGSLALAILASGFVTAHPAAAAGAVPDQAACAAPVLDRPMPAADAAPRLSRAEKATAAARNGVGTRELFTEVRADRTIWLDRCGRALYVEPTDRAAADHADDHESEQAEQHTTEMAAAATAPYPTEQTFALHSRPGSSRTIYLDFEGETVTGSIWNEHVGATTFTVPPYSMDSDTRFSTDELTEIQRAWAVVAEDYAPFDVNVTTADPGRAALERTSTADHTYGARVVITANGPVYRSFPNGAGGVSYIDIVGMVTGSMSYQPSWVFTDGTGTDDGTDIAEAISHEVGHAFGLHHDGDASHEYSTGSAPWAPIMGASYYHPITQWSLGEYAGANNREDDTAVIAAKAPYVRDDHGDDRASATAIASAPRDGLISTRADRDAFSFDASGTVEVRVTPTALKPNLDVGVTVLGEDGAVLGTVAPRVATDWFGRVTGLDAVFRLDAPREGATFTVVVDGVGSGDPATAGRYSDYGSLGAYRVQVTPASGGTVTEPSPDGGNGGGSVTPTVVVLPPEPTGAGDPSTQGEEPWTTDTPTLMRPPRVAEVQRTRLPVARLHRRYVGRILVATHGSVMTWTATGRLPRGVRVTASPDGSTVRVTGRPRRVGRFPIALTGVDPYGRSLAVTVTLRVRR